MLLKHPPPTSTGRYPPENREQVADGIEASSYRLRVSR